ncbi:MAG: penicillin acylase family protein [Methylacidiphilales bacterium]|nr:penicillin acylase family protein [Candidatus Methylacidiphilales bacterium]
MRFNYLALLFILQIGCVPAFALSLKQGEVKIIRDAYGVPAIFANSVREVYYGYGYAVAQDRLFQMEMIRRSTQGQVAEVLGVEYLAFDKYARNLFWKKSILAQIDALSVEEKAILDSYADGMNAYIDSISSEPQLIPHEFKKLGMALTKWNRFDVVMVFVGTMAGRYSDFTTELENLKLLGSLRKKYGDNTAQNIFNQLKWIVDPLAPTTIPRRYGSFEGRVTNKALLPPDQSWLKVDPVVSASEDMLGIMKPSPASNIWILGKNKSKNAEAILVNGPQFGLFDPGYVYAVSLHAPGFEVSGTTPFAYPCIIFGHNNAIGWGSTAGFGDLVDLFVEKLHDKNKNEYLHQGVYKPMEVTRETILVKNADPVIFTVSRSVHGNIIALGSEYAISKARSWEGTEVKSMFAWLYVAKAKNYQEWLQQASQFTLSINWYLIGSSGVIGYSHVGRLPLRHSQHDSRFPILGTGEYDWKGFLPFTKNPKFYDPSGSFLTNWNNSPMHNYPNPDMLWWNWSIVDRVNEINIRFPRSGSMSASEAWDIIPKTSEADLNARYFVPLFLAAMKKAKLSLTQLELLEQIKQWSRNEQIYKDGKYSDFLKLWISEVAQRTFTPVLDKPYVTSFLDIGDIDHGSNNNSINNTVGVKALYYALLGKNSSIPYIFDWYTGTSSVQVIQDSFFALFTPEDKSKVVGGNTTKMFSYSHKNFLDIPQSLSNLTHFTTSQMNRGTQNNMIVFAKKKVSQCNVTPPGQNGTMLQEGQYQKHGVDQLTLYNTYQCKQQYFYESDIVSHSSSQLSIIVK